jgi:uncharacterized membrane protein
MPWYVGLDEIDFELDGQEGALINVTLVHPKGPDPGLYLINLLGLDEDNDVSSPYTLMLDVPSLSETRIEFDYSVIPVHPSNSTSVDIRLFNLGNEDIGYDLFLDSPPGWHAGFDDLSSQGGANSASTGLMLEDGQMSIGITFVPPQVMTLAGAELTVVLQVVSQTEEARSVDYELPLVILETPLVTVDLESSFSSIIPGNTLSLQYTIENRGNVDLVLSPKLQLPTGWTQNTAFEDIDLDWTESRNIIVSITAEQEARSGDISLIMESGDDSWSNTQNIDVTILAEPVMTFASVEIEGETWTNIFGPGQHPTGVAINYTWVIENMQDTEWTPSVTLQLENNMLGECTSPGVVSKGDVKAMTCTILISAMADPGTEPEFTVLLSADQISVNKTVTMLVALTKELSWKLDSSETLQTGTPSTFQITITNTGNSLVSGTIEVQSPSEISVEFEGADIVNLDAGQSQKVRLMVTSNAPGSEVVKLSISGVDDVTGSSFELQVSSEGDKISDGSSSIGNTLLWSFLILIPLLAIIPVVTILRSRQNKTSAPNQAPPNAAAFAVDQAQQVTTPCFSCRQPILSGMLGCPSCGARYHSVCNVNTCVNCGAEASTFVNA